ncbi:unnamed protein product [Phytophthora lilii]|uniref:Unnamed protein product n=1 Tax=Phytophthora lilii TaxID=2077276 RepID=A0A9W6WSN6_9STRA|nr:unnamed protein product [Phytophthora lilii]
MNVVFDAETGEQLELFVPARLDCMGTEAASTPASEPPQEQPRKLPSPARAGHRETQSQRVLGDYVDWERQQVAKVEVRLKA